MNRNQIIVACVIFLGLAGLVLSYFLYGSDRGKKDVETTAVEQADGQQEEMVMGPPRPEEDLQETDALSRFLTVPVEKTESKKAVPSADATVTEQFEYILNEMLAEMAQKAFAYKKKRKVLKELITFENKDHIEENFLVLQDLSRELYKDADEIMNVFARADQKVKALVVDKDEKEHAAIWKGWQALKQDKADVYQKFFTVEHDLVRAYERLMRFYFIKRPFFTIDEKTKELKFEQDNDQRLASKFRLQINRLEKVQEALINKN